MAKQQLVLAFFENEAAADKAVADFKNWDKTSKEIKYGAIGVMVKDEKGKIKTQKLGERRTKGGAILFTIAALLSGGILLAGALVGGALGSLFHKGLGMSKEDLERINKELDGGKAAVGILVAPEHAEEMAKLWTEFGAITETHEVSEEAAAEAEAVAEKAPEAAAPEAPEAPEA
jgi:hypothetical protein